jgi:hypothetical protein
MNDQDFGIINARLEAIIEKQNRQIDSTGKIFDKLEEQSVAIGKIETRLIDVDDLKKSVKENSKWIALVRGIGIAITAVYGAILALFGFK